MRPSRILDLKTRMTVPDITPEQAEALRMFVWRTAIDAEGATPLRTAGR